MTNNTITIIAYYFGKKLGAGVFMENLYHCLIPKLQQKGYKIALITNHYFLNDCGSKIPTNIDIVTPKYLSRPLLSKIYFLFFFGFSRYSKNAKLILFSIDSIIGIRMNNVVSIIHDLNEFAMKNKLGRFRTFFRKEMVKNTLRKARNTIVISEFVKQQIKKYLPSLYHDGIKVIHSGIPMPVLDQVTSILKKEENPYFIIVGRIDPKAKCLYEAVSIFTAYKKRHNEFKLKIVGGINSFCRDDAEEFLSVVSENNDIEYLGYVSDEELNNLYRNAFATIFMSKLEGFGFPLLESFYRGCPVIASSENLVSKEISNGLVISISETDLLNEDVICEKINQTNSIDREELVSVASQFTWEMASDNYYECLSSIIKQL